MDDATTPKTGGPLSLMEEDSALFRDSVALCVPEGGMLEESLNVKKHSLFDGHSLLESSSLWGESNIQSLLSTCILEFETRYDESVYKGPDEWWEGQLEQLWSLGEALHSAFANKVSKILKIMINRMTLTVDIIHDLRYFYHAKTFTS